MVRFCRVRVRLGENNLKTDPDCDRSGTCAPKYIGVPIEKQIIFKTYQRLPEKYHDIALLRLQHEVAYSDFVKPICLPTTVGELYHSFIGEKSIVAGWGLTEKDNYSDFLLKVEVPYVFSGFLFSHFWFIRFPSRTWVFVLMVVMRAFCVLEVNQEKVRVLGIAADLWWFHEGWKTEEVGTSLV